LGNSPRRPRGAIVTPTYIRDYPFQLRNPGLKFFHEIFFGDAQVLFDYFIQKAGSDFLARVNGNDYSPSVWMFEYHVASGGAAVDEPEFSDGFGQLLPVILGNFDKS
jgi:hypothetical protein